MLIAQLQKQNAKIKKLSNSVFIVGSWIKQRKQELEYSFVQIMTLHWKSCTSILKEM